MKQIEINDTIRQQLKAAVGEGVDISKHAVFRAVALNSLPIRQKHPLYLGGVYTRTFLQQMADALQSETIPLQVSHNSEPLPAGRIFSGEVTNRNGVASLEVLFFVDPAHQDKIDLINNGTVDQVSVSILAKEALSNKSGFDFFSDQATFENIWTGTDPDGNVMGRDGAHVLMNNLDHWYEMSLVGQGGARGARILPGGSLQLASGTSVSPLTLTLSTKQSEPSEMDLTALVEKLTSTSVDLATRTAELATANASLSAKDTRIAELEAQLASAQDPEKDTRLTAAESQVVTLTSRVTELEALPAKILAPLYAAAGTVSFTLPEGADAIITEVTSKVQGLRSIFSAGQSRDAASGKGERANLAVGTAGFKTAR